MNNKTVFVRIALLDLPSSEKLKLENLNESQ